MNTEDKQKKAVKHGRIKYSIYRVSTTVVFVPLLLCIMAGMAILFEIAVSELVETKTVAICTIAFFIISMAVCLSFDQIIECLSYIALRRIKKKIYCPACGSSHDVVIRGKAPANEEQYMRYLYRWCPRTERVVNIYTVFDKDYDDEVLHLSMVAADYDKIYQKSWMRHNNRKIKYPNGIAHVNNHDK